MIAPNLEDIYTQGCLDLQLRETGAADDTTITELAFLLPLAVRQYQRLDQDDPSVDAPVFARLSPAERNGCALLWLALSGGDVANVSEARGLEHHIRTLRMDRLALEKVFGNLDFDAEHLEILPAWARAGFAIFQFALESGDTGDVFVELPAQLDIDGADFDSWLQTTDSPAFWHILVEHHVGLLSPDAIHWILSRPDCDIGTAASFLFRFRPVVRNGRCVTGNGCADFRRTGAVAAGSSENDTSRYDGNPVRSMPSCRKTSIRACEICQPVWPRCG